MAAQPADGTPHGVRPRFRLSVSARYVAEGGLGHGEDEEDCQLGAGEVHHALQDTPFRRSGRLRRPPDPVPPVPGSGVRCPGDAATRRPSRRTATVGPAARTRSWQRLGLGGRRRHRRPGPAAGHRHRRTVRDRSPDTRHARWSSTTIELRAPRVAPPACLAPLCSTDRRDRAAHTYGRCYRDTVRLLRGDLPHPPDLVAHPADEADVVALLDWCASAGVAVIPFGGGSSVVGGVEADVGDGLPGGASPST